MFLSALSVLGEERGEPRWAWFLGTWKISSRVKILPGLWHNMTEVFEWSVGSCLLSRSFFFTPSLYPFHPARPRPPFLIPFFFSNAIIPPFLHFRDVECVQALTFAPINENARGSFFSFRVGHTLWRGTVFHRCDTTLLSVLHRTFYFTTLKRGWGIVESTLSNWFHGDLLFYISWSLDIHPILHVWLPGYDNELLCVAKCFRFGFLFDF